MKFGFSGDEFFTNVFNNVMSLLLSGDEIVTIAIPTNRTDSLGEVDEYIYVRSDFLKVSDTSMLRSFLSLAWWFAIGYPFLKWLYLLIYKLNQGKVGDAIDQLTTTKGVF